MPPSRFPCFCLAAQFIGFAGKEIALPNLMSVEGNNQVRPRPPWMRAAPLGIAHARESHGHVYYGVGAPGLNGLPFKSARHQHRAHVHIQPSLWRD
jgi:hypothetical protein